MKVHVRMGDDHRSAMGLLCIVMLFAGVWYYSVHDRPVTNYPVADPQQNYTVVAFGDSLVTGVGALQKENSTISILERELQTDIVTVGQDRQTVRGAWSDIRNVTKLNPQVVILSIGTEDSVILETPEDEIAVYMERSIGAMHESGSSVIIVETPGYAYLYRNLAREHQTAIVTRVTNDIVGKEAYMFDQIHPNDAGHKFIANKIQPVLQKILSQ